MHALVWVPSFRAYFCCIRTFSAMAAISMFLGVKFFNEFVSGFVVRLNICQWLGEKFLVKHVADKFYRKFFIWARKEFL